VQLTLPLAMASPCTYSEVEGDLFTCPATTSLAHCISADVKMSKGIAVLFKTKFAGVPELLAQKVVPGGCAVLRRGDRHVYYLVTKEEYFHKPTYATLRASLLAMLAHCQAHDVTELAMPQIGCGLDGLKWPDVKTMICDVFKDSNIKITVYVFKHRPHVNSARNQAEAARRKPHPRGRATRGVDQYFSKS